MFEMKRTCKRVLDSVAIPGAWNAFENMGRCSDEDFMTLILDGVIIRGAVDIRRMAFVSLDPM